MRPMQIVLLAAFLGSGSLILPQVGHTNEVITSAAPPPLKAEIVGRPREGYVWAPGHWVWGGSSYRWVAGVWILEHGKSHWVADTWMPMGDQWRFVPGHWES